MDSKQTVTPEPQLGCFSGYNSSIQRKKTIMPNKELTQRLIDRIKEVEKFEDIAELCEDFQSFVDEIQEWGVTHIGQVDLFGKGFELNPDLDPQMLDEFFSSFGYTKANPHPAGRYANPINLY